MILAACGRLTEALRRSDELIATEPEHPNAYVGRMRACEVLGRLDEAAQAATTLARLQPAPFAVFATLEPAFREGGANGYWRERARIASGLGAPVHEAASYVALREPSRAFAALDRAFEARDADLGYLVSLPDLAPLRSDPRFADLARRMNLPLPPKPPGKHAP